MNHHDIPTPYTSERRPPAESVEQLRARIPGWGVDLDPKDRPSVPRLQFDPQATGASWTFPQRQPEEWPRERSIEHAFVTPVFGTSCPPKGLSGRLRTHAYRRYSEARAAHWLLLLAADRVDAAESRVTGLLRGRPDNPVAETGIVAEGPAHGLRSRLGRGRADVMHHVLDPAIVAAPLVVAGGAGLVALRRIRRRGASVR